MMFIDRNYCHPYAIGEALRVGALSRAQLQSSDGGVLTDCPISADDAAHLRKCGWIDAAADRLSIEEMKGARLHCAVLQSWRKAA